MFNIIDPYINKILIMDISNSSVVEHTVPKKKDNNQNLLNIKSYPNISIDLLE